MAESAFSVSQHGRCLAPTRGFKVLCIHTCCAIRCEWSVVHLIVFQDPPYSLRFESAK